MPLNLNKLLFPVFLCFMLFSATDSHAGILIKKQGHNNTHTSSNAITRLSEKLAEYKTNHKVSFLKKLKTVVAPRYGYGDGGGRSIFSIISMISAIVAYCCLVGAALGLILGLFTLSLYGIIACGVFSLAAVILGIIGLQHRRAKGFAMAGIIMGGVLLTLIVVVGLFFLVAP